MTQQDYLIATGITLIFCFLLLKYLLKHSTVKHRQDWEAKDLEKSRFRLSLYKYLGKKKHISEGIDWNENN